MQYKFYYLLSEKHTTHRQEIFIGKKYNGEMKTLLLTSQGMQVKDEFIKILPKPANEIRLAHVITASNEMRPRAWLDHDKNILLEMGIQVTDIDIQGKTIDEVRIMLKDMDVIYVQGGDPYFLLKYAKESGFDTVVKELIDKGIIYVGVSAGTYLAGPTVEQGLWRKPDRDRHGLTDYEFAMGLVPFLICVHYESQYAAVIKEGMKHTTYPVRILTDDQALLIQDDVVKFVGTGEEVKL